jgi:hypothetical protein
MPQLIGNPGAFHKERAINRRVNTLVWVFIGALGIMFLLGAATSYLFGHCSMWAGLVFLSAAALAVGVVRILSRLMDQQLRLARSDEDGAAGEREIIPLLMDLPDTYAVISDLDFADSYGNIDHLVIGPTGLFAIDVKKWRGNVTPDGNGELLHNGKPTDKPQVRYFTRRVMELKDRLKALARLDPYVQALFVFPHTHIQAPWGSTGKVNCLHAHRLADYIQDSKSARPIPPADLSRLISAAKALKETIAVSTPNRGSPAPGQP